MQRLCSPPPAQFDFVILSPAQITWPATPSKRDECKWAGKDFGVSSHSPWHPHHEELSPTVYMTAQEVLLRSRHVPWHTVLPVLPPPLAATAQHPARQMLSQKVAVLRCCTQTVTQNLGGHLCLCMFLRVFACGQVYVGVYCLSSRYLAWRVSSHVPFYTAEHILCTTSPVCVHHVGTG